MQRKSITLLVATIALLGGCATNATPPTTRDTVPELTAALSIARASAVACPAPEAARPILSAEFKYGCFCGAGHPDIRHSSGRSVADLSLPERMELIEAYYRIQPIDDIDAACQAHDVCWVMHGRPLLQCNDQFRRMIDFLEDKFTELPASGRPTDLSTKCGFLANNMSFATTSFMEAADDFAPTVAGQRFGRVVAAPLAALYAGLFVVYRNVFDYYPAPDERCRWSSSAPKPSSSP